MPPLGIQRSKLVNIVVVVERFQNTCKFIVFVTIAKNVSSTKSTTRRKDNMRALP
jgi:hypothetical protein